jgi:hypothetical protein
MSDYQDIGRERQLLAEAFGTNAIGLVLYAAAKVLELEREGEEGWKRTGSVPRQALIALRLAEAEQDALIGLTWAEKMAGLRPDVETYLQQEAKRRRERGVQRAMEITLVYDLHDVGGEVPEEFKKLFKKSEG